MGFNADVERAACPTHVKLIGVYQMPKKVYRLSEGENAQIVGLQFTFEDGTVIDFDPSKVNDDIKYRAMMHGFSQKIGDSYAGASKAENALAFAKEATQETIAQLYAGDWRAAAESGPKAPTDLAVALSRILGKTPEECQTFVDGMDDEQKKVYRKKGKVAAELAKIAAEKAQARAEKLAKAAANAEKQDEDEEEITLG